MLNDLRKFLKKSIRALPRLQREAVELAFFNGLSHREIAAATRAPLGTVKTRLELGLQSSRTHSGLCATRSESNPRIDASFYRGESAVFVTSAMSLINARGNSRRLLAKQDDQQYD